MNALILAVSLSMAVGAQEKISPAAIDTAKIAALENGTITFYELCAMVRALLAIHGVPAQPK